MSGYDHNNLVGSWTFDFEKKIFFATNETYLIFGRQVDDFDGSLSNVLEFIVSEDREAFKKAMFLADQGIPLNIKFRIYTAQGELKYIFARGEMFYHQDNSPDMMIGTVQDITKFDLLKNETESKLLEIEETQSMFLIGSWSMDLITRELYWSESTYKIYGMDPLEGPPTFDVFLNKVIEEDRSIVIEILNEMPHENPFEIEFRIVRPQGEVRHIKHLAELVRDSEGTPIQIRGNIHDVTDLRELEIKTKRNLQELNHLKKRLNLMIDNSEDVFEIVDETGKIKYISPAVEKMMGFKSDEIKGKYIWDFVDDIEVDILKELFQLCIMDMTKAHLGIVRTVKKSGENIYLEVSMKNHLVDPEVNGIVLNWKDVTTKVNLDQKVHHLVNFDELTGLPNRAYFKEVLAHLVDANQLKESKFGVFMIDVDEFKGINNVLSFEFGDRMIKKIGDAIETEFKSDMFFLARFYGDQFGLIVDNIDGVTDGQNISERILSIFDASFVIDQYELFMSASIGYSIFPDDSIEKESLIKYANIALSRAKDLGKQKYQAYSPLMDIKSYKDFSLRNDLKKAIENHELEVYYQPIVNLETSEIIAAEALTRWHHPEWGLVPPSEFIPIAESTGLIIHLGKWLLEEVCLGYKIWLEKGFSKIKVSVNYSVLQFYQVNFVKDILDTIKKHELKPDFLILEITESVLINQSKQTEKDLNEFKKQGIQIAIDDFGTGYSSLTYLSAMNVDVLKIDQRFMEDLKKRVKSEKILKAIINLAKDLNLKLVAEGVSEWDHLNFLKIHKCFAVQGYLYSKAVKKDAFERLLSRGFIQPGGNMTTFDPNGEDKRKSGRIALKQFTEAEMTIVEMKKKLIKVGKTKALMKDIGLTGISFISNVKFPVRNDIVLQFRFELNDALVEVQGTIVWTEEIERGKHLFGCEFLDDESNQLQIEKIVQAMQGEITLS